MRRELGVGPIERLDPWGLAEHLAVPVWGLDSLVDLCPTAVDHFTRIDPSAFSAVTVFHGAARVIVHNESHSPGRQASNVAHELSHALLLHPPSAPLNELGCRDWDPVQELEANWLAGVLLITDEAALSIVRRGLTVEAAADLYGVSPKMVQFRINVTGAATRVARYAQARHVAGKRT